MDVTPVIPAGRQVIESYGPAGFRITGVEHAGPVIVFPTRTLAWAVVALDRLTPADFDAIIEDGAVEVLLLGCGARMGLIPSPVRSALKAAKIGLDPMDTGAACRTYNVSFERGAADRGRVVPGGRAPALTGRSLTGQNPTPMPVLSTLGEVVREHDRDRFRTVLFAPADRRDALFALYAFNFEVARIPETVSQPMLGQIRLKWWMDAYSRGVRRPDSTPAACSGRVGSRHTEP